MLEQKHYCQLFKKKSHPIASYSPSPYDRELLQSQVQRERFASRSEVVRAGLRLLDDYELNQKLQRIRAEIAKGDADFEAGRYTEYDDVNPLINKITNKG